MWDVACHVILLELVAWKMASSWNCSKGQIPIRGLAEFQRLGLERDSALNKITLQPMPRTRMVLDTAQDS
jgi:hypothetical protein